jgi:hypothetical protein
MCRREFVREPARKRLAISAADLCNRPSQAASSSHDIVATFVAHRLSLGRIDDAGTQAMKLRSRLRPSPHYDLIPLARLPFYTPDETGGSELSCDISVTSVTSDKGQHWSTRAAIIVYLKC